MVRRNSGLYGYERALQRVGLEPVAGADEAGRGACAGPLVAAAVILSDAKSRQIPELRDSKLLTAAQRERCYDEITAKAVAWSVVPSSRRSATRWACTSPTCGAAAGAAAGSMWRPRTC